MSGLGYDASCSGIGLGEFCSFEFQCIVLRSMYLEVSSPLPFARKHPSYGDCLQVKREYYQISLKLLLVMACVQVCFINIPFY